VNRAHCCVVVLLSSICPVLGRNLFASSLATNTPRKHTKSTGVNLGAVNREITTRAAKIIAITLKVAEGIHARNRRVAVALSAAGTSAGTRDLLFIISSLQAVTLGYICRDVVKNPSHQISPLAFLSMSQIFLAFSPPPTAHATAIPATKSRNIFWFLFKPPCLQLSRSNSRALAAAQQKATLPRAHPVAPPLNAAAYTAHLHF